MKPELRVLEGYLIDAQDKIHEAIGLCIDQKIEGFGDLRLLSAEIYQMRMRISESPKEKP